MFRIESIYPVYKYQFNAVQIYPPFATSQPMLKGGISAREVFDPARCRPQNHRFCLTNRHERALNEQNFRPRRSNLIRSPEVRRGCIFAKGVYLHGIKLIPARSRRHQHRPGESAAEDRKRAAAVIRGGPGPVVDSGSEEGREESPTIPRTFYTHMKFKRVVSCILYR